MKYLFRYLTLPALCVGMLLMSGTSTDPMTTLVPGSGCALANPVPPGSENPFPPDYGGPCVTGGWGPSQASEALDDDSPNCLTCDEARQLRDNRQNMAYIGAAATVGLGLWAAPAGAIAGLITIGIQISATQMSRAMERAGC